MIKPQSQTELPDSIPRTVTVTSTSTENRKQKTENRQVRHKIGRRRREQSSDDEDKRF
jgi:hypothetical protein